MKEPAFTLWLEFEEYQDHPEATQSDPENDFCNIAITLASGERYALNVWTFRYLQTAREVGDHPSEEMRGRYLFPPDLFVERLDRPTLEAIAADLLRHGGLKSEWLVDEGFEP